MTFSKIFLYFCLSFIGGIFVGSLFFIIKPILLVFSVLGILLISVFWKYPAGKPSVSSRAGKKLVVIGFCILFLVLGIWWHQQAELRILNNQLRKFNDSKENITLIGVVAEEPDRRERSQRLTVQTQKLIQHKNTSRVISGKALIITQRYPEYQYGDELKITGKLATPPIFEEFNYRDYLKKDGIYSVMSWPEIEVIGQGLANPIMKTLFSFKNKFKETTQQFISPPQQGILEALIFGDEENISQEWKNKLNLTGTRHITAVSGMNITIISFLILNFLLLLGFWRQQAFYLTIFLLILYILMIGAPASAVRAGVMGSILLLAQHLGRISAAQRAVVFAATLMLAGNPLLLRLDVGFQLSFLAILGIVYFQSFFSELFRKIPNPKIFPVRTTLSTTLSAQIFTLPILIYNFGYISLTSPITNILIVPFLAPLTILIFVFGLTGLIFYWLGFVLSLPVWLVLTYLTKIIDLFSKIPFASLKLENISWAFLIIVYLILAIITRRLQESQKLKFLKY